jgi:hypothetical protein
VCNSVAVCGRFYEPQPLRKTHTTGREPDPFRRSQIIFYGRNAHANRHIVRLLTRNYRVKLSHCTR